GPGRPCAAFAPGPAARRQARRRDRPDPLSSAGPAFRVRLPPERRRVRLSLSRSAPAAAGSEPRRFYKESLLHLPTPSAVVAVLYIITEGAAQVLCCASN